MPPIYEPVQNLGPIIDPPPTGADFPNQSTTNVPGPPLLTTPNGPPGDALRGLAVAVIDSIDNGGAPKFATVLVNNKIPGESGYIFSSPAPGPFAKAGTAGFNYFYNDPATHEGGSLCQVDLDRRIIIQILPGVSTSAPTPYYKAITDHLHAGNLNPDGFTNPQPVNLSSGESSGLLPYTQNSTVVQGTIDLNGNLLTSEYPGQMVLQGSGTYAGYNEQVVASLKDTHGITVPAGSWLWMDWSSLSTNTAAGWGPAVFDNVGNYYWVDTVGGAGTFYRNATAVGTLAANTANDGHVHIFTIGIQYVGGTVYRIVGLVDQQLLIDYTDTTSPFVNPIFPGFKADSANIVYHKNFEYYGSTVGSQIAGFPSIPSGTTFTVTSSAINSYPSTGGGTYNANITFTLNITSSQAYAEWLASIVVVAKPTTSGTLDGDTNPTDYHTVAVLNGNTYTNPITVTVGPLGAGSAYQLGVLLVDQGSNESSVAPFIITQAQKIGPGPINGSGNVNLIPDSNFAHASFSNGKAGSDPYWNFYLIDGVNAYIGQGGAANGANYCAMLSPVSGRVFTGQSEVIPVTTGVEYCLSGYIDATSAGSGAAWKIMSTDLNTTYLTVAQTAGVRSTPYGTWTCPAGVTQVTVQFTTGGATVSNILVFAQPQLEIGSSPSSYKPGTIAAGPQPTTAPPAGGTGGGAGYVPPVGGGGGGHIHLQSLAPGVTRRLSEDGTLDVSNTYPVSGNLPYLNHGTAIQGAIDSSGNLLLTEFPNGKLQADGSLTNVDSESSHTAYTLFGGQPFTVSADISKGIATQNAALVIGTMTNGYSIYYDGNGQPYLVKYVSGVGTVIGPVGSGIGVNTNYHSLRLTVTPGVPNTIEGSVDGWLFTATDSALTLTSGTWPVTLFTGGNAGKVLHYSTSGTAIHHGALPVAVTNVIDINGSLTAQTKNMLLNGGFAITSIGSANTNPPSATQAIPFWYEAGTLTGATFNLVTGTNGAPYTYEKADPYALQMTRPANAGASTWSVLEQRISINPNQTFSYRMWYYFQNEKQSHMKVAYYKSDGTAVISSGTLSAVKTQDYLINGTDASAGSGWTLVQGTFEAPNDAAWLDFSVLCGWSYDGVNPAITYFDNIMLVTGSVPMMFSESVNDHSALAPSVGRVIDLNGNLLATEFAGQTVLQNSGTYVGSELCTEGTGNYPGSLGGARGILDPRTFPLANPYDWVWMTWVASNPGTGLTSNNVPCPGWGPAILDANNNGITFDCYNGSGSVYGSWSGAVLTAIGTNGAYLSPGVTHTFRLGVQWAGGSVTFRFVLYVDSVKCLDWNYTGGWLGPIRPGFVYDAAGYVYIKDVTIEGGAVAAESLYIPTSAPLKPQGNIITSSGTPTVSFGSTNQSQTQSTITVTVPATTYYLSDGSSVTVPSAAPAFANLTPSQWYYFNVYALTSTWTWQVDNLGTAAPNTATNIVPYEDGHVPVQIGISYQAAAYGSGGTSGGGSGGSGCPATYQLIETLERGFVPAGTLQVGEHLRDPEDGWNRINAVEILPTVIWRITAEGESVDVNRSHAIMDANDEWIIVTDLHPGDVVRRAGGGTTIIEAVQEIGPGEFAALDCDRHRYMLGKTFGHNFTQSCPAVYQLIETLERGFVPAGTLRAGEHLRDPEDHGWNVIYSVEIRDDDLYRVTAGGESVDVNATHMVMDDLGKWRLVTDLHPGNLIRRSPEGNMEIEDVSLLGSGQYAAISCERHRYLLGSQFGHNITF